MTDTAHRLYNLVGTRVRVTNPDLGTEWEGVLAAYTDTPAMLLDIGGDKMLLPQSFTVTPLEHPHRVAIGADWIPVGDGREARLINADAGEPAIVEFRAIPPPAPGLAEPAPEPERPPPISAAAAAAALERKRLDEPEPDPEPEAQPDPPPELAAGVTIVPEDDRGPEPDQ